MKEQAAEIILLSNGAKLSYVKANSRVGHLCFFFKAGSRWEGENNMGLAHFLEHCIFKGTKKRSALSINSRLDEVGGDLNAFTSKEEICVYATFLNKYTIRSMDLIADLVQNSIFPEKEIQKEKKIVIDEINSYKDSPSDRMMDEFDALFFPNHSLGHNILGTKKSVKGFKRQDLLDFVNTFFTADNLVISYVGKYSKQKLVKLAEEKLEGMPKTGNRPETKAPDKSEKFEIRKKESNFQSHVIMGAHAPSYQDKERTALHLLINFLGGPAMNSRLNLSIREKFGLAYHVEANYSAFEDAGFWGIYFSTDQKNLDKAIELARKEMQLLFDKGMTVTQLRRTKYQFLSQFSIGREINSVKALSNGKSVLIYNTVDTLEEIYHEFEAITLDEINAVAKKYLDPHAMSLLIYDKK